MARFEREELNRLVQRLTLEDKVLLLTGPTPGRCTRSPASAFAPSSSPTVPSASAATRGTSARRPPTSPRRPHSRRPGTARGPRRWTRPGGEARRKDVDVVLAPTINLHRTPYGGRHFEAFSEDPVLTAELAGEYVRGIQEYGVGATVKHYVVNESETDRFTVDVRVDDRTLRELYLLAFEGPSSRCGRLAGHERVQLDQRGDRLRESASDVSAQRRLGLRRRRDQ